MLGNTRMRVAALNIAMLLLAGCVTAPDRPSHSSYGCMKAVRDSLPAELPDKRAHCIASAWIAQRCSVAEAYVAGTGKEVSDLFTGGDAEWADWRADRVGIACSRHNSHDDAPTCCMEHGY